MGDPGLDEVGEGGGGTYDTGLPDVEDNFCALDPKVTVVGTASCTDVGKVGSTSSATAVTRVFMLVDCVVICRDAGQFTRPVEVQITAVYMTSDVTVLVSKFCLLSNVSVAVMVGVAVVFGEPLMAHASANSVYQIGIEVAAAGPHVLVPTFTVAPAAAPNAS